MVTAPAGELQTHLDDVLADYRSQKHRILQMATETASPALLVLLLC